MAWIVSTEQNIYNNVAFIDNWELDESFVVLNWKNFDKIIIRKQDILSMYYKIPKEL